MSYRVYLDYDDDRDVITCVTLSDPHRRRRGTRCIPFAFTRVM
jgi:hypothetical protein